MAEKLSESAWTAFTRKNKLELDDGALIKALARLDKSDEAKAEQRQACLAEVIEQVKKQVVALVKKKKELGDKLFGDAKDKLYELLDRAESDAKQSRLLAAERAAQAEAAAEEEDNSPRLLTQSMVPLVRQLQKGEVQMKALIALAGKATAVLIMRRDIAPTRRKMLAEYLEQSSGIKYIKADCTGASGRLEFLLDAAPGGLSKRVRAALFEQTGLRVKVFLQFGDQTDEDNEDEDPVQVTAPGAAANLGRTEGAANTAKDSKDSKDSKDPKKSTGQAPAGKDESASGTGTARPTSAEQQAYTQQRDSLDTRLQAAWRVQHPESSKLRALSGYASEKAEAGDYTGAGKALLMIDKLLTGDPRVWSQARESAVTVLKQAARDIAALKDPESSDAIKDISALVARLPPTAPHINQVPALRRLIEADEVLGDVCALTSDIRTPLLKALATIG